jgi:cation diffusion facilitator CzcD-associated flavoprotein CzcO
VTSDSTDTSVVVIGGGQAGLSVSYYLKRLGLDPGNEFVVLDRGPGTGGAWQFRWDALRIGSAHRINDLPGLDALGLSFDTADRSLPAKEVVADYYAQYEEFYGFQIVRPAAVTRVENAGDRMIVTFADDQGEQTVSTDVVINATGTWGSPFIPWYPGRDSFAGRHVHTAEYADAAEFAGRKVVVVGGGTSAIGFLLELETVAAETTWVSRRPIEFLEDGELNLEARASAVAMQDEAARAGKALPSIVSGTGVPRTRRIQAGIDRGVLTARPMFSAIEPGGVRWSNGSFQEADVIIWSTGFRPELRHLSPLKLREKEGGIIVANGTSWKEPRIFFAGYGPQASTIGANRAGRTVARQAIATLSRLKRQQREAEDARLAFEAAQNGQPAPFDFLSNLPAPAASVAPAVPATLVATGYPVPAEHVTVDSAPVTEDATELSLAPDQNAPDQNTPEIAPEEPTQDDIDLSWMLPSAEPIMPLEFLPDAPSNAPVDPVVDFAPRHSDAAPVYVEFEPAPEGYSEAEREPEPDIEPRPEASAPLEATDQVEPQPEHEQRPARNAFAESAVLIAAAAAEPDDEPKTYVFQLDVEPEDDDFDGSTKPREWVRPPTRELPDFDDLLNPRSDD